MRPFVLSFIAAIAMIFSTACESGNGAGDALRVTSSPEMGIGVNGGHLAITYELSNPEDYASLDITLSAEWMRVADREQYGILDIEIENNADSGSRMGAVTLSYGGDVATVVVTQSKDAADTALTLTSEQEMNLARGGNTAIIRYTLANPTDSGYIYAKTECDWISSIDTSSEGEVALGVATNMSGSTRSTTVTVGYEKLSFDVLLTQSGEGDVVIEHGVLHGYYYGDQYSPGVGNYWLVLSDRGFDPTEGSNLANATYYRIDAYGVRSDDSGSKITIPEGTYTFDSSDSRAIGTFSTAESGFYLTDSEAKRGDITPFEAGELIVEKNRIVLSVTIDGEKHQITYEGTPRLEDAQEEVNIYTTLDGDVVADLSDHYMLYECYGDYYDFGYYNWMFVIMPNSGSGDCFQFDIITAYKDKESGFYGDYVCSEYLAKSSFIPGWTNNVQLLCSWYFTADQEESAPFRGGEMSVKDNGDGTVTVTIDVVDDLNHRITGTWTGTPKEVVAESSNRLCR